MIRRVKFIVQVVKETLASLAPSLAWAADQLNLDSAVCAVARFSSKGRWWQVA